MTIPEKIGRYEIVNQLGQGGMAVVYLAQDPLMSRRVAIKLLPRALTFNAALRSRFQREARIIANLEHPAIVPVHDFGEFNEQPYLVMRYMVGGSLGQRLQQGPLALPEVVRILTPLAQALDKAHAEHIIHRDLKPDNILFDGDNNPYLSDFGIARLAEGTQTTSIMGTPAYMSPEQITGDVELDGRSDIYAMGVIIFEMLSGEQPYTGETPTQVMMKHVLEPVPAILDKAADLPPTTQVIIDKAMAKDRGDRYASAEELVETVAELLTASQAAEVGAAIAGARIEETMLEMPEEEIDPLATVVERPVPKPVAAAAATEAALPEQTAAGKPGSPEKQSASRRRPLLLLGCAGGALLLFCVIAGVLIAGYFYSYRDREPAAEVQAVLGEPVVTEQAVGPTELPSPSPSPTAAAALETAAATVAPTQTPPMPTEEPTAPPATSEPGSILFADDFDGKSSVANWDLWADEDADFTIANGQLIANGYNDATLNWVKQMEWFTNLELTVSADILEGGRSAFFGVIFGGEGDNYVGCFVQGDNSAYCGSSLDGESAFGDWVVVELSVLQDNEILFVISDAQWAMAVNQQCVGSGTVDFGPEGQPGLVVSTADSAVIASVTYDNLIISSPTDEGLGYLWCEPIYYE